MQRISRHSLNPIPVRSTLLGVPSGIAGVKNTLNHMRRLTRQYKKSPVVRQLALAIVDGTLQKNYPAEIHKIHSFVRDRIRYVKDINGVETLQSPVKTLEIKQGDCDDKATLLAALLESIGHPTRFVALGFRPNSFNHVLLETRLGRQWISLETTEPVEMGWYPPNVMNRMVRDN